MTVRTPYVVAATVGGTLAVILAFTACGLSAWFFLTAKRQPPPANPPDRPIAVDMPKEEKPKEEEPEVMSRGEFERKVRGCRQNQVLAEVGKPFKTYYLGDDMIWEYHGKTRDEISGRVDRVTAITFWQGAYPNGGFVSEVNY